MERYFEIEKDSRPYKDYFEWWNNYIEIGKVSKEFMTLHGMKTTKYSATSNVFYIEPADEDSEKFSTMLSKNEYHNGLRSFKKNSKIGKAWLDKQIKV